MPEPKLELIRTNLRRYTFESPKIRQWVEENCSGRVLNLFAGKTKLDVLEYRVDINQDMPAEWHEDAFEFVSTWAGPKFDTVILDPPYSYRKSMEMYHGKRCSKFKLIADALPRILQDGAKVISFGYHSTFMGEVRGWHLENMCIFAHGGAQHCTIGIVECGGKEPK